MHTYAVAELELNVIDLGVCESERSSASCSYNKDDGVSQPGDAIKKLALST